MAEKTYTLEQAAEKLGKSPEDFKEFAKQNNISELREGTNILYNAKEVDAAAASADSDDTVLNIEDSVIGLNDESSLLGLAPLDEPSDEGDEFEIDADMSSMVELTEADTRSGLTGLTDEGEEDEGDDSILSLADSMNQSGAGEEEARIDADADIDSASADGSGSGLLDLSLQADDSQFGAVLDDILPGGEGDGGFDDLSDSVPSSGDEFVEKTQNDDDYLLGDSDEQSAAVAEEEYAPTPAPAAEPVAAVAPAPASRAAVYQVQPDDPASGAFGVMMLLPLVALIFAVIVVVAGFRSITPSIVEPIKDYVLYVFAGLAVLAVLIGVIGAAVAGGSKEPKAPKSPKAPKAKKVKAPKKKKK